MTTLLLMVILQVKSKLFLLQNLASFFEGKTVKIFYRSFKEGLIW